MLMISVQLRNLDESYNDHRLAWAIRSSEGIKKNQKFKDFFDYEKLEYEFWYGNETINEEDKNNIKDLILKVNRKG